MHNSIRKFIARNSHRFLSPWAILSIDLLLVVAAFVAAYFLRFNFIVASPNVEIMLKQAGVYGLFCLGSFLVFRTHKGIVRHTGMNDLFRMFASVTFAVFALWLFGLLYKQFIPTRLLSFSLAILLIAYMASLLLLVLFRLTVKVTYLTFSRDRALKDNILIFGAGEMGIATLNTINATVNAPYHVVGFVDDNPGKHNKSISGMNVYGPRYLTKEFLNTRGITHLILAVQDMPGDRRRQIIEQCLELDIKLLTVPGYKDWHAGRLMLKQIRKVRINELLERTPIKIDNELVASRIRSKVVMVTGAAGSIGSELARQILRLDPKELILLDQAETPLFDLEQELQHTRTDSRVHYVLGDVSHPKNMRRIFKKYRPEYIYHAAAYKHVPMLETNPFEALRVNLFGTRNLAMLAFEFNVANFVLISTDKVVNPTSFMGVSKRLAEIYVQSLGKYTQNSTRFITTRFGNVLGSNGSVIPIFEKQIAAGGPVTVTHPEMKRFFMTIPEACELVLEAGVMGHGGNILVFDMGEQVRIVDVARKMIKLSGLEPEKDVEIVFTGLRPGEKLYEELFSENEENLPTHHPKIMIARLKEYDYEYVSQKLEQIEMMLGKRQFRNILSVISELIPEYKAPEETYE